jgi:predicted nucleotidyltransferase
VTGMVRLNKNLEIIKLSRRQIDEMINYLKKQKDVLAFYLYGSYGTEHQTPLSDVDFAVLPISKDFCLYREMETLSELQFIAGNDDINLINLLKVPITLQIRVLETGKLLYCKDDNLLSDFKELVIRYYCDFEPDLRVFYRDYDAGLREEFLNDY